jgi:hypothetical protein
MTEPTHGKGPDPAARREMTYKGRRATIHEGAADCRIEIDGVPVPVARLGPGSYHSHTLMYQAYPTAESLAQALIETEGTLWLLPKPGDPGHPHDPHGH